MKYSLSTDYDGLNQPSKVTKTANLATGVSVQNAQFSYLADGRIDSITRFSGFSVNDNSIVSEFEYLPHKQIDEDKHHAGHSPGNQQLLYKHDTDWSKFRLTAAARTIGSETTTSQFQTHADLQLTTEVISGPSGNTVDQQFWDLFGNPLQDPSTVGPSPFSVGAVNRLLSDLEYFYDYDDNDYDDNGSLTEIFLKIFQSGT